jgi:hypothetical protein
MIHSIRTAEQRSGRLEWLIGWKNYSMQTPVPISQQRMPGNSTVQIKINSKKYSGIVTVRCVEGAHGVG